MITATNNAGEFGVPGFGVFKAGETRAVPPAIAAWLRHKDQFTVKIGSLEDYAFRDETGAVRYLGYVGPVDSRFGYGGMGINILRVLTRLGIEASVNPHYNNGHNTVYRRDLPQDAAAQTRARKFLPQVDLVHCLPDDLPHSMAPRKIMWTMWESSKIPDGSLPNFGDWAALINANAEQLVVPSEHSKAAFSSCGVEVPITVLPYGLDTEIWPYFERPTRETFTVFMFGDLSTRKGPFEAMEAFQRAFPTEKNVRLVLKTAFGHFGYVAHPSLVPKVSDPRIYIIDEVWSRPQLVAALHNSDAFIWPSRGEGFGLPPMQALLTGCPVITTTHTGMANWFNSRIANPIATLEATESPLGGEWYEPDIDSAAAQLRKVYENRKGALHRAKMGSQRIRRDYSLEAFAQRLSSFLEGL
jgi:glycosyltransferase involved in cell wall biosynthesis